MPLKLLKGRKNTRSSSRGVVEDFATQHAKNVELAHSYHQKKRQIDRENRDARESERKTSNGLASQVEMAAKAIANTEAFADKHTRQIMPNKRQLTTSATFKTIPKLVWPSETYGDSEHETFTEMAIASAHIPAIPVDATFLANAFRDGVTVVCDETTMVTEGLNPNPFYRVSEWKKIAAQIVIKDVPGGKSAVNAPDHLEVKRLGVGTYNAVISIKDDIMPPFVPAGAALRITRNDKDNESGEYKYINMKDCVGEAANTIFCSFNGVGPRVYSVVAYNAIRSSASIRYGVGFAMEKADADLNNVLRNASDWSNGARYGRACVEMIYRVSRLGIFAADVKTANVLCFSRDNPLKPKTLLTDCDSKFFVIRKDLDWRSLLLVNLALLTAHVRNGSYGDASRGFASIAYPVLHQLWKTKLYWRSEWLFQVPPANVKFDNLIDDCDFDLQKMFAIMATSYFYGEDLDANETSSARFAWRLLDSTKLDQFWAAPENRRKWPAFSSSVPPLISQICEFAWERVATHR